MKRDLGVLITRVAGSIPIPLLLLSVSASWAARTVPSMLAVALLVGPAGASGASDSPITFEGIGVVHVGMTPEEASSQLNEAFSPKVASADNPSCFQVHTASQPTLLFMVENGRIVRVETNDRKYRTWSGVRVGDTEKFAREKYGRRCNVLDHHYDPKGHYLVVRSADKASALVLETDGERVVYIRAGRLPAAEYVEGCL